MFFRDDSLEDLVEKYYLMKKNKKQIVENAFKEVCTKYSWDIITDKLINFYQDVIRAYKKK